MELTRAFARPLDEDCHVGEAGDQHRRHAGLQDRAGLSSPANAHRQDGRKGHTAIVAMPNTPASRAIQTSSVRICLR